jgi:2-dehydro-3-deoxy-D-arabinonate dehydratase
MQLIRFKLDSGASGLGIVVPGRGLARLDPEISHVAQLLRLPLDTFRVTWERAIGRAPLQPGVPSSLLAPIDGETEVWAAGVTYLRSEAARVEESATPDIYTRVYTADRPELFFKATPRRVAGPEAPIAVRADSTWDVPEPELALVVNAHAEVVGYTIGNDVSSRSIEGDNPLYLPQAKVYAWSFAAGPAIVPAWEVADPYALGIRMRILREHSMIWSGDTSTAELKRRFGELVEYLFREDDFPDGVVLSTGTALVPDSPFTLLPGDEVEIEIDGLGLLRNPVIRGKRAAVR